MPVVEWAQRLNAWCVGAATLAEERAWLRRRMFGELPLSRPSRR
ncbi:MAG: hypothetical protein ACM3ZF_06800 [Mycobacterium leprae]